ncbi:hypothetical protein ACO0QE_001554 [Hanseniaspora vineae]
MYETLLVKGVATQVFHIEPLKKSITSPLLFFVPGNPGFIQFYETFLKTIHSKNPNVEIVGISHKGFTDSSLSKAKYYDVADQIEQFQQILYHFNELQPNRPISLMGHSFGCYVIEQVVLKEPQLPYEKLHLFMPTVIDINKSASGRKLETLNRYVPHFYLIIGWFTNIFKFLPVAVVLGILKYVMKITAKAHVDVVYKLIRKPELASQSLFLARNEMSVIQSNWQAQKKFRALVNTHKTLKEVDYWFACKDHWVAEKTRKQLINFYKSDKKANFFISSSLKHAFPLDEENMDYIHQRLAL